MRKRPGNLAMLSPASGQNLPKSVGSRGDDLMKDGAQAVKPVFPHVKIPARLQLMPTQSTTHVTCSGMWHHGSTGMGRAWQVLPCSLLEEELQDEVKPWPSFIYLQFLHRRSQMSINTMLQHVSEDPVLEGVGLQQWRRGRFPQKPDIKWHVCLKQIDHSSGACNLDTGQLLPVRECQGASKLN